MDYQEIENRVFVEKYTPEDLMVTNIDKLLKDKLFVEVGPCNNLPSYVPEESICFDSTLYINSKEYEINKTVLKEIYFTLLFFIEEVNQIDDWDVYSIEVNVDARFSDVEKIEYLKEKRKELLLTVQKEPEYYIYTEKREFNGYDNWKDLILDLLLCHPLLIEKYLTNDIKDLNDISECGSKVVFEDWHNYYKTKALVEIYEIKLNELIQKNIISSGKNNDEEKVNEKIDLSFQLALLEKIMKLENWDDISSNKKGKILTNLLGKNKDNIKEYYIESARKSTDVRSKFYDQAGKYQTDILNASKLLKEILG